MPTRPQPLVPLFFKLARTLVGVLGHCERYCRRGHRHDLIGLRMLVDICVVMKAITMLVFPFSGCFEEVI